MTQEVQEALNVIKNMSRQVVANLETHEVVQKAIQVVEKELSQVVKAVEDGLTPPTE